MKVIQANSFHLQKILSLAYFDQITVKLAISVKFSNILSHKFFREFFQTKIKSYLFNIGHLCLHDKIYVYQVNTW